MSSSTGFWDFEPKKALPQRTITYVPFKKLIAPYDAFYAHGLGVVIEEVVEYFENLEELPSYLRCRGEC